MIQYIIVFGIIAAAIIYTVFSVVRSLKSKDKSPCDGCGGCDIKKEILKNRNPDDHSKLTCCH